MGQNKEKDYDFSSSLYYSCIIFPLVFIIIVSLIPVQPVSLIQKVYQPYSTYLYGIYFNLYFMILWLSTFGSYEYLIIIVALSPFLYYIKNSSKKGEKILLIAIFLLNLCNIKYIPVYAMFWFLAGDIFPNKN